MIFTYSPNKKGERQGVREGLGGQDSQALAYGQVIWKKESKKCGALISGVSGVQLRQASIGASSVDGHWPAAAPGLTLLQGPFVPVPIFRSRGPHHTGCSPISGCSWFSLSRALSYTEGLAFQDYPAIHTPPPVLYLAVCEKRQPSVLCQ